MAKPPRGEESLARAPFPGTAPRDMVTGPRPWDCTGCTWAYRHRIYQLKYIHAGCRVHYQLPVSRHGSPVA